jgi:hypothetical protein
LPGADICWALTPASVRAWLEEAKPGDVLVYAKGTHLIRNDGVEAITRAAQAGKIRLNFRRGGDGSGEYIATRRPPDPSRLPHSSSLAQSATLSDRAFDDSAQLMGLLCRLAQHKRACPTNRALGDMMGGVSPERVSYLLRKNEAVKTIRVECAAGGQRVVTILASGLKTGGAG